jgi:hypothetical protein
VTNDAPRLAIAAGLGTAALGFLIAALSDGPYLTIDGINAGVILVAVGLFAALFATPFAFERATRELEPDRERRWERALLRWGGVSAAVLASGVVLAFAFGLHGATLGGSLAIVLLADALLILGTLVAWMFSN